LLAAAHLRFFALARNSRFHPDEALFATFARQAAVNGDWLLLGPLDKPPLSIYANALAMIFVGNTQFSNGVLNLEPRRGEFAARLPGTFASILLVATVYALAQRLYRGVFARGSSSPLNPRSIARRGDFQTPIEPAAPSLHLHFLDRRPGGEDTAIVAMLLTALSPYAVAFSATAFTDGLMLLCIILALGAAGRGRWFWSGVWLALGYASKQQALLYLPLLAVIAWRVTLHPRRSAFRRFRDGLRFSLPLIVCLIALTLWDAARSQPAGLWALAVANNDPARFVYADELIPRLLGWLAFGQVIAGHAWLTAGLMLLAVATFVYRLVNPKRRAGLSVDAALWLYLAGYGLLHWLVAFNIYDRYLLLVLPIILLLMARGLVWAWGNLTQRHRDAETQSDFRILVTLLLCGFALCLVLLPAAWDASADRSSVGADRGKHSGIDALADYLNAKTLGAIVYDHWLGWELGYYMGIWTDKRRVYYPTPHALATDARLQADPAPRYFVAPLGQPVTDWLDALRGVGFKVTLDYCQQGFKSYRLIPPQAAAAVSNAGSSWPGPNAPCVN
jgi:4-amino-4-deoxy-L-arabinose transferase-like glycosyltransferase